MESSPRALIPTINHLFAMHSYTLIVKSFISVLLCCSQKRCVKWIFVIAITWLTLLFHPNLCLRSEKKKDVVRWCMKMTKLKNESIIC